MCGFRAIGYISYGIRSQRRPARFGEAKTQTECCALPLHLQHFNLHVIVELFPKVANICVRHRTLPNSYCWTRRSFFCESLILPWVPTDLSSSNWQEIIFCCTSTIFHSNCLCCMNIWSLDNFPLLTQLERSHMVNFRYPRTAPNFWFFRVRWCCILPHFRIFSIIRAFLSFEKIHASFWTFSIIWNNSIFHWYIQYLWYFSNFWELNHFYALKNLVIQANCQNVRHFSLTPTNF